MKLALAVATIAICLPLTSMLPSASSSTAPERARLETPRLETPRLDGSWFEGTIAAWRVEEDGAVLIQLQVKNELKWFRTPANQSSNTQFELLTLHAILAFEPKSQSGTPSTIRICGEATTERDGDEAKHAMRLLAIGRG